MAVRVCTGRKKKGRSVAGDALAKWRNGGEDVRRERRGR